MISEKFFKYFSWLLLANTENKSIIFVILFY
jgi:hypothetical protein